MCVSKHSQRCSVVFILCMSGFVYNLFLWQFFQSDWFVWKNHDQHQFPICGRGQQLFPTTHQRYKFKRTLRFHRTYFRLLMLKWGQLHIWDPDSKTSPLVESSQSVSVGSSPNQLRIWSSVCESNKCRQYAFFQMMQRFEMPHGTRCQWCSHTHMSTEGIRKIFI